jgi:hypothetical protein
MSRTRRITRRRAGRVPSSLQAFTIRSASVGFNSNISPLTAVCRTVPDAIRTLCGRGCRGALDIAGAAVGQCLCATRTRSNGPSPRTAAGASRCLHQAKPAIHLCSHVGQAFRPACERDLQG